ncbi:MAG: peptide deformylase [Bdellovibrionales bacterium]|nr:peptide deformylase [Bdellovibrionales bacterium]
MVKRGIEERAMAVLDILKFPDPGLRRKCSPVKKVTEDMVQLAEDMLETMYASHGIGLSAIQVNRFVRLLTADTRGLYEGGNERYQADTQPGQYESSVNQPLVLFNPTILSRSGEILFKEGCLSFPSYYAEVKRSKVIEVKGWDKLGKLCQIKTDGVLAICIQHEIDHLDGKLFIDHLSPIKADRLRAQIKKYGYPTPESPTPEKML